MPNIFDQTEKLIHEFGEIRDHNANFKSLYNDLCSDELLMHYKVFGGENKANILRDLNAIEEAIKNIGLNMSSHRAENQ
jgi:hypothetical protein